MRYLIINGKKVFAKPWTSFSPSFILHKFAWGKKTLHPIEKLWYDLWILWILILFTIYIYTAIPTANWDNLQPEKEKDALVQLFEDVPEIKLAVEDSIEAKIVLATDINVATKTTDELYEEYREERAWVNEWFSSLQNSIDDMEFHNKLFTFVSEWEWAFQSKAFCDSYYRQNGRLIRETWKYCDRWSIWYGTLSYWGETITQEEWNKRRNDDITRRNWLITSNCLKENQRIATVDFMYQHWNNSSDIKYYANTCNPNAIYNTIVWWRDVYKGKILVNGKNLKSDWLVKREQLRINLFYK